MSALAPIAPQTVSSSPTTLVLKEKKNFASFTGDSGKIKDAEGNTVFEIDAHLMTISERRTLKDAAGAEIGQIRKKKSPGIHPAMRLGTPDDEKKCMVKVKGMMNVTKCDADIYIGDDVVGEASGNWRAKSFQITLNGNQVATIGRKTGLKGRMFDADTYFIEIVPGQDTAFIVLITIALDELYHDKE